MTLGEKIKLARLQKGFSIRDLAKKCGWESSHSRLANYESGIREPGFKDVKKIAEVLGYPAAWFYVEQNIDNPNQSLVVLNWGDLKHYLANGHATKNAEIIELNIQNLFGLRVRGNSMSSIAGMNFIENSIIFVNPFLKPQSEDFVIAILDDGEPVFRQIILEGHERYLKALNPSWKTIDLSDKTNIIGVVISSLYILKS